MTILILEEPCISIRSILKPSITHHQRDNLICINQITIVKYCVNNYYLIVNISRKRRSTIMIGMNAEVITILEEQIQIEQDALENIVQLENNSKETAVRLTFLDLRLNTWKHIKFSEGIIEILTTTPCDEWSAKVGRYSGRIRLERELSSLVIEEGKMISQLEKALDKISDPIAKQFLKHMKDEESNHSKDLMQLVKIFQMSPLQTKKGVKGTDIVCDTD